MLIVLLVLLLRARLPAPIVAYALSMKRWRCSPERAPPRPRFIFTGVPARHGAGVRREGCLFTIVLAVSSAAMIILLFFYTLPYFQGRFLVAP